MEQLRNAKITIEIDTNKRTINSEIVLGEDESLYEFYERAEEEIKEVLEVVQ
jgi:hypothetical protein